MGGYEKHKAREEALQLLGRSLARRARSRCELCEDAGVSLSAFEVPPVPSEPDVDRTLFLCDVCHAGLQGKVASTDRWRFLETSIWNDFSPVKVCSFWMLTDLVEMQVPWATPLLDMAYLTDEEREWVDLRE